MPSTKEFIDKITVRLVVTIILLLVMSFTVQAVNFDMETGIEVQNEVDSVSEKASVIEYSTLSKTQKNQFRSNIGVNFQDEYITAGVTSLVQYDYIYSDGVYYNIDSVKFRQPFHYLSGLFLGLLSIFLITSLVSLSGGLIAGILDLLGMTGDKFIDVYNRLGGSLYVRVCLAVVLIVGSAMAPSMIGIQTISAERISATEIPESADVTSVKSLSEKDKNVFYSVSSGQVLNTYKFENASIIKSEEDYYQVSIGHPYIFSIMFLIVGSGVFLTIVRGLGKRILADLKGKKIGEVRLIRQYE